MTNKIIYRNNQKYRKTIKKRSKQELYEYLKNRNFYNFLEPEEETTSYELFRHIDDNIPKEDKAKDLIYLMSLLHTKTTTYESINIEKIKAIYEDATSAIIKLDNYYHALQDHIEEKIYFSPAEYLLMKNISKIYKLLNKSKILLDSWYSSQQKEKNYRIVLLHQNLKLSNIKEENNNYYLINWDNYKKDIVIYDFLNFYQNEYKNIETISLFELYQSKYPLTKTEINLLLALIAIPPKLEFNKSNYEDTVNTKYLVTYIDKTNDFISKYNIEN